MSPQVLDWLVWAVIGFLSLRLIALIPIWALYATFKYLPRELRLKATLCFLRSFITAIPVVIFDSVAPLVVGVALLFTRWESERLPSLFWIWDIDKPCTINGDVRTDDPNDGLGGWSLKAVPLEDTPEARSMCYWASGHPRSFYARWVWLGLRNRASRLAQKLGVDVTADIQHIPVPEGTFTYSGNFFRFLQVKQVGRFTFRTQCGYKIPTPIGADRACVVSTGFSFKLNRQDRS